MTRYVALLRAINVGGRTVTMERLRSLFESLGLGRVESFIASGNVIFETRARDAAVLERRIERHLAESLGFEVATFLRSPGELADVVAYEPFASSRPAEPGHTLWVGFLRAAPSEEGRQKLLACRTDTDEFHSHGREAYWLRRTRLSDSTVTGARLEKALGMPTTWRNITTVRKLALKYASP